MINIANLSEDFPVPISEKDYDHLIKLKTQGWSNCQTQTEWMAKLHYLRSGFKENKISREDFFKRERDLILRWWARWC